MTEALVMKKHVLLILALLAIGCGGGTATRSSLELINPALGPDYSSWMAGAAARLATPEEINEYVTLGDDTQAAAFIERFWQKHNPTPGKANPVREAFESRSAVADNRYSESGQIGRRTDRGVIYVLYGLPKKIDHEVSPVRNGPPLEVWIYGTDAASGLTGERPNPIYRFVKSGDLTVLYHGRVAPRALPLGEPPE
jgi:GWxTD domain-containing protein